MTKDTIRSMNSRPRRGETGFSNQTALILIAACYPLGIASMAVMINTVSSNSGSGAINADQNMQDWPDVQKLGSSGIEPLSDNDLVACRKLLRLEEEKFAPAHPDNFGERDARDILGRQIPNKPSLIVLHETVISAPATIDLFQTPHPDDNDRASYHMLVSQKGDLIRIVPDVSRAYGSGYSRFGDFTIHRKSPTNFSINNIALHISLETPADGRGDVSSHSGYADVQYNSLAKQVLLWQAKYGIPIFRLTTHASVDRSHSRYDPRTFRWDSFDLYHRQHAATCGLPNLILS